MRMEIDRRQFIAALKAARPALDRGRDAPEVLRAMRMRVSDRVAIEATDLDIEITSRIALGAGQRRGAGDFILPQPDALLAALRLVGGETVVVESRADGALALTAGEQSIGLQSEKVTPEDYPSIAAEGIGDAMRVGDSFLWALLRLMPAVSEEETRYYLNGIAIRHLGDWAFRMAATDGHRLHVAQVEIPDATGPLWDGDLIISRRTLKELQPLLHRAKAGGVLAFGHPPPRNSDAGALTEAAPQRGVPTRVQFATEEALLTGKLIDGTYPDYMRVIPESLSRWFEIDRKALKRAVRLASAAMQAGDKMRAVRLTFTGSGIAVTSTLPAKTYGIEAASTVAIGTTVGMTAGEQAGFNGRYLIDALDSFTGETLRFAWPEGDNVSTPCRVDDPSDDKYFVVLMPMRV